MSDGILEVKVDDEDDVSDGTADVPIVDVDNDENYENDYCPRGILGGYALTSDVMEVVIADPDVADSVTGVASVLLLSRSF